MKNLGTFWDLILKPINYSLDYAIKIIGIFGLIWGIYILIPGFTQKSANPLSVSDLFQVSGAIILIVSVISALISTLIIRSIKSEKFKQLHYIQIPKAWWIVIVILDLIAVMALVINIFCLSGHCILSINQIVTNTLLTIASSFSAITGIVYIYSKDAKELLGHRILFLHDKGDKLRESYINFINALGFDDDHTKTLYRNSWKLIQPENWPNLDTINQIQHNIRNQSANFTINVQAILVTYNELLYSVKEVANAGSTRIFSRNRDLVESTSLEAYFYISNLWIALDPISRMLEPQNHIQLTLLENQLKDSAFRSGIVLIDLCKFAFRIKPLLKNTTTCQ